MWKKFRDWYTSDLANAFLFDMAMYSIIVLAILAVLGALLFR